MASLQPGLVVCEQYLLAHPQPSQLFLVPSLPLWPAGECKVPTASLSPAGTEMQAQVQQGLAKSSVQQGTKGT